MYCHNCGKQIDDDAKFCEYCGTIVSDQENVRKEKTIGTEEREKRKTVSVKIVAGISLVLLLAVTGIGGVVYVGARYMHRQNNEVEEEKTEGRIRLKDREKADQEESSDKIKTEENKNLTDQKKKRAEAYYNLLNDLQSEYGEAEIVGESSWRELSGLSFAKLVDMNNDGNDEMILAYGESREDGITSFVEIYTYEDGKTMQLHKGRGCWFSPEAFNFVRLISKDKKVYYVEGMEPVTDSYIVYGYENHTFSNIKELYAETEGGLSASKDSYSQSDRFFVDGNQVPPEEYFEEESVWAYETDSMDYYLNGMFEDKLKSTLQELEETRKALEKELGITIPDTKESSDPGIENTESANVEAEATEALDVEAEVQKIRDIYYGVQYNLDTLEEQRNGKVARYLDSEGRIKKITAYKGADQENPLSKSYAAEYYYEMNSETGEYILRFMFVFGNSEEYRFYFDQNMRCIRYIGADGKIQDFQIPLESLEEITDLSPFLIFGQCEISK